MSGLSTEARPTQRSLFRSIYNIIKVIFSLNKRLRDRTLFSLFFQTEKHPILQIGPQAETLPLKLLLVGSLGRVRSPKVRGHEQPGPGWTGVVRYQNQGTQTGRQHLVTVSHMTSHAPHVGTMRFSSVSHFILAHTSSFCNEVQSHPNRS